MKKKEAAMSIVNGIILLLISLIVSAIFVRITGIGIYIVYALLITAAVLLFLEMLVLRQLKKNASKYFYLISYLIIIITVAYIYVTPPMILL